MGISLDAGKIEKLAAFWRLVREWNNKFNLTSVADENAVAFHFLDSLAPLAHGLIEKDDYIVDIGAGAGFPSIPIAIALGCKAVCIESVRKKADFIAMACAELKLDAEAVNARAEDAAKAMRGEFDAALSRAVASLPVLAEYSLPLLKLGGRTIAYKGPEAKAELSSAKTALNTLGGSAEAVLEARVPGLEHYLVVVKKIAETPDIYPRPYAKIKKKPL